MSCSVMHCTGITLEFCKARIEVSPACRICQNTGKTERANKYDQGKRTQLQGIMRRVEILPINKTLSITLVSGVNPQSLRTYITKYASKYGRHFTCLINKGSMVVKRNQ